MVSLNVVFKKVLGREPSEADEDRMMKLFGRLSQMPVSFVYDVMVRCADSERMSRGWGYDCDCKYYFIRMTDLKKVVENLVKCGEDYLIGATNG
jgi:hypothetical protein